MWSLVWDDPKLPNDSGEVPEPDGVVGGFIPGRDIFSPLERKTSHVATHLLCSKMLDK